MKRRTARESLFERLVINQVPEVGPLPTPCWIWHGSICNKGYGMIRTAGITKRVHIAAWELVKGRKVRAGYTLDHVCRNKACWRPSHMTEMTRAANTAKGNRDNPRSTEKATVARRSRYPLSMALDAIMGGSANVETVTTITSRNAGNGQD